MSSPRAFVNSARFKCRRLRSTVASNDSASRKLRSERNALALRSLPALARFEIRLAERADPTARITSTPAHASLWDHFVCARLHAALELRLWLFVLRQCVHLNDNSLVRRCELGGLGVHQTHALKVPVRVDEAMSGQ